MTSKFSSVLFPFKATLVPNAFGLRLGSSSSLILNSAAIAPTPCATCNLVEIPFNPALPVLNYQGS